MHTEKKFNKPVGDEIAASILIDRLSGVLMTTVYSRWRRLTTVRVT